MKKTNKILIATLIVILCAAAFLGGMLLSEGSRTKDYTVYIGTNDKDTGAQERPYEESKKIVSEICGRYVTAYTLMDANGYWTSPDGEIFIEQTVVCYLSGVEEAVVRSIARDIVTELNQYSVMVTQNKTNTFFIESE